MKSGVSFLHAAAPPAKGAAPPSGQAASEDDDIVVRTSAPASRLAVMAASPDPAPVAVDEAVELPLPPVASLCV
jgi:hypothetical protein